MAEERRIALRYLDRVPPLDLDAYLDAGGFAALKKTLTLDPGRVLEEFTRAILRGRGGAGFPAGIKGRAASGASAPRERYVVCNADEGEPGTFKDRIIMEEEPFLLLEGMAIAGWAIGALKGYIYVRGEYDLSISRLRKAVRKAEARGLALRSLEFLVVADIFMTQTTQLANVVLPAASFAEKEGTFVNSDRRVLRVRKAVQPPGEAREDLLILQELARRMGRPIGSYAGASEVFDEIARVAPILEGIDYGRLEAGGLQWPCPSRDHPGTSTLFLDRFNTPDGLARLNPVNYEPQSEQVDEQFPFLLNTGRILYQYHSSTMSRRSPPLVAYANEAYLLMHPADAHRLKLEGGETVRITSRRGSIETRLRVSGEVAEGELFMPFHFEEAPVNKLTRDELDPDSKIAPFKLSACRVTAAAR